MTKHPQKHLLPFYFLIAAPLVAQTWSTGAPIATPRNARNLAVAESKLLATGGDGVSQTLPHAAVINALSSTTLNFDSVNTSAAPHMVDATAYLNSNGISVSTITPGTHLDIVNDLGYYNGQAVRAPSPPNTLTQLGSNAPVSFTLSFSTQLDNFSFKRSSLIAATSSGVTFPYWRATALNAVGTQIGSSVGENNFGSFTNVPAATFSMTGPGIASVRFDSENRGTGFSAVVLDDFVLSYAAPMVTSFTATPSAIAAGGASTLSWTTTNATSVTISGVAGTQPANGSLSVTPASTTTYTLTATGAGGTATATATVTVNPASPKVVSFVATPAAVTAGQSSTLSWTTTNATSVTISGVAGTQAANGSTSVTPASTTTYTLTATGAGGTATATATVTVNPASPKVVSFVANPSTIVAGQSSTLSWTTTNATSVTISGVAGTQPANGSLSVTPASTTTYTLTATGAGGTATATATVTVNPATPKVVSFVATPATVTAGQSSMLNWTTTNATSVTISGVAGTQPANGSLSVTPASTTTYTLTATGAGGTASATATVTVNPASPKVVSFVATPATVTAGQSSMLSWTTTNATSVTISGVAGTQSANGSLSVTPASTTTYTLTATGAGGTASATATVTVNAASPKVVSFVATPTAVTAGQSSTLSWTTTNATSVTISGVAGTQAANGSLSVTPASTTTYTLTATGTGGTASATATVTVVPVLIRGRAVRHPGPSAYVGQVNLVLTMPLEPDERQFFELNPGALTADNLTLSPAGIVFPPQPARGYRVTLGDQTAMVMLDGTFRLAAPLSATTGEIVSLDGAFRKSFTPDLLVPEGATPKTIEIPMLLTGQTSGMSVPSPMTAAKDEDLAAIGDAVGCLPSSACKDVCPDHTSCCLDYNGWCSVASQPARWQGCLLRFQQLINSTCFWWIARGPCANEAAVVHVDGPSCYVNHKGRYCQEMDPTTLGLQLTAGTVTESLHVNPRVVDLPALFPAPIVTETIDVACGSTATLRLYNNTFDPETWLFLNAGFPYGCTAGGTISPSGTLRHYETAAAGFKYISNIPISYTAPSDIRAECDHRGTDTIAAIAAGLLRVVTIHVDCSRAASITSFVANPSTITGGQSSTLSWVTVNATSVSISGVAGSQPTSGSLSVSLSETTTFTLTARGPGATATATVTVTVNPTPPTVVSFVANPPTIAAGQSSTLSWMTTNATAVSISGVGATQPVTGSVSVSPAATTTYTLTATGPGGKATAMATVTVNAAPSPPTVVSFTASPATITAGQTSVLSWTTTNATSVSIDNGVGPQQPNNSVFASPSVTTTYRLTAMGPGGTATATATVAVNAVQGGLTGTYKGTFTETGVFNGFLCQGVPYTYSGSLTLSLVQAGNSLTGTFTYTPKGPGGTGSTDCQLYDYPQEFTGVGQVSGTMLTFGTPPILTGSVTGDTITMSETDMPPGYSFTFTVTRTSSAP